MSNAHDLFAARYKEARARMGMTFRATVTIPPPPATPLAICPKERAKTRRKRKIVSVGMFKVRQMLDCQIATVPREHFNLVRSHNPVPVAEIQRLVAEYFQITVGEMMTPSRRLVIAFARQVAIYLARLLTRNSLHALANLFGGLDHTTVMYSARRVEALVEKSDYVAQELSTLRMRLVGNDGSVYYGA